MRQKQSKNGTFLTDQLKPKDMIAFASRRLLMHEADGEIGSLLSYTTALLMLRDKAMYCLQAREGLPSSGLPHVN